MTPADFGAVQILGSGLNKMSDSEILHNIQDRTDLEELSKSILRVLVDRANKMYRYPDLYQYIAKDKKYSQYHEEQKQQIGRLKVPGNIKDSLLFRSMLYRGIESGIIDKKHIIQKYHLTMPSDKVLHILDNLRNPKILNIFSLWDPYFLDFTNN